MGYMHIGNMEEAERLIRDANSREDALHARIAALEQHVSELEMSLESVRKERDEALLSAKHGWDRHAEKDRAYCEALAGRDRHAQSAETWRKRVEAAAEALSDVLPGEVGRLDLLARISALKGQMLTTQIERDEARTELAQRIYRLKPSGQVADADLWCDACAGIRPHRRKPSPDAGPFWRCSECGSPFRPNSDHGDTDAAVAMLRKLATKAAVMGDAPPSGNRPSRQVAEDEARITSALTDGEGQFHRPEDGAALSRLAAKAQGYEAAVADNAEQHRIMEAVWRKVAAMHYEGLGLKEALDADHPGAALLEEVETLRQRQALWEEAANALYGYTVFVGPCAHGRDPWGRCYECGKKSAVHALVKVNNALTEQHRKEVDEAITKERAYRDQRILEGEAQAKNDGLELAAQCSDDAAEEAEKRAETASARPNPDAANWDNGAANEARNIATRIRAMKEPEQ